ncbi:hypothetical protein CEP54_000579 [Fusarium duplospermum]|uniref:Uncharacterized protein n=1 Tax=Fusarium duplospermum TaxID=1325734 RepID=A0A428R5Q6_9HYPO|nr:hypothetical protein CEP54_000579 [Fusarium duplospermum]
MCLSPALAAVATGFTWAVLDVKTWENRFLSGGTAGGTAASPTILQRMETRQASESTRVSPAPNTTTLILQCVVGVLVIPM